MVFSAFPARCKISQDTSSEDYEMITCDLGGQHSPARNYTISKNVMDFDSANAYCAGLGMKLTKWDSVEKYFDVGMITSEIYKALRNSVLDNFFF